MAACLNIVLVCVVTSLCNLVETADIPYMRKTITDHFSENRNHVVNKAYKDAAMKFIFDEFKRFGLDTEYNEFSLDNPKYDLVSEDLRIGTFTNVIGILKGSRFGTTEDRIVGVGAHYDTVKTTKGVNDNGSGVAAMLEAARQISQPKVKRTNTIMFVAIDIKEYDRSGSAWFVGPWILPWAEKNYGSGSILLRSYGGIILDSVMNYNTSLNSQSLPQNHSIYFPNAYSSVISNGLRGDFVHMVYRESSHDTELAKAFESFWMNDDRRQFGITAVPVNIKDTRYTPDADDILPILPDAFRSDYINLWLSELPAIFLTDSANLRGNMRHCYHKMCDDLETMLTDDNLNFLGKTADTIAKTLESLSDTVTSSAGDVKSATQSIFLLCLLTALTVFN